MTNQYNQFAPWCAMKPMMFYTGTYGCRNRDMRHARARVVLNSTAAAGTLGSDDS